MSGNASHQVVIEGKDMRYGFSESEKHDDRRKIDDEGQNRRTSNEWNYVLASIMKKFWDDFKAFAIKGNMIDLAIGVVIGAAFNKIIDALVKGLISPPLGYLTVGIDLGDKVWVVVNPTIDAAGKAIEGSGLVIKFGMVLENGIDFLIIALTIFIVLRLIKNLRDKAEDENDKSVPTPKDIQLLAEIRDGINSIAERDSSSSS